MGIGYLINEFMFRTINLEDFDVLYDLWEKAGLALYPYEQEKIRFISMHKLNPDLMTVLLKNGKIIGSILGAFDGRTATVHRLAILPEYQNKGYGSMLMEYLEKQLKDRGIMKLALQVHVSNKKVIDYYKKKGFKDMDYVVGFYRDL